MKKAGPNRRGSLHKYLKEKCVDHINELERVPYADENDSNQAQEYVNKRNSKQAEKLQELLPPKIVNLNSSFGAPEDSKYQKKIEKERIQKCYC